jgi:hypothetical protein
MKGFFELLGFASTALISGFLVFSYVGQKKNADKPNLKEMTAANFSNSSSELPELRQISSSQGVPKQQKKGPKDLSPNYATEKKTLAVESASVTEKLKNLYADEDFVVSVAKKWKKQVADASETHSVKPQLLLSNVIVKSYLGNYSTSDFNRDVSEHAGDLALPTSTALKSYDYSWSVGKIAQQYNLTKYFPAPTPVAVAKVAPSYNAATVAKKTTAAAQRQKAKPQATVSPVEAEFREMVAKEEGFTSWQGLQRLGDLDTKKNAERRVKMLMSASRVR